MLYQLEVDGLAVGADQEAGLRRLAAADRPLSVAEPAAQVPGLSVDPARGLVGLLLATCFLRAALGRPRWR